MPLNIHIANGQEPRPDSHIHKKDRLDKEGNMTDNRQEVISIYHEGGYKFPSDQEGGDDRGAYLLPRQSLL